MKSKILNKYIVVTWEDAWASDDYWTAREMKEREALMCDTVGFCIQDEKRGVGVVRTVSEKTRYRSVHFIPRKMIQKIRILK